MNNNGLEAATADFFCDPGTELEGNGQRVCQPNGEWNSTHPSCTKRSEFILIYYFELPTLIFKIIVLFVQ